MCSVARANHLDNRSTFLFPSIYCLQVAHAINAAYGEWYVASTNRTPKDSPGSARAMLYNHKHLQAFIGMRLAQQIDHRDYGDHTFFLSPAALVDPLVILATSNLAQPVDSLTVEPPDHKQPHKRLFYSSTLTNFFAVSLRRIWTAGLKPSFVSYFPFDITSLALHHVYGPQPDTARGPGNHDGHDTAARSIR